MNHASVRARPLLPRTSVDYYADKFRSSSTPAPYMAPLKEGY